MSLWGSRSKAAPCFLSSSTCAVRAAANPNRNPFWAGRTPKLIRTLLRTARRQSLNSPERWNALNSGVVDADADMQDQCYSRAMKFLVVALCVSLPLAGVAADDPSPKFDAAAAERFARLALDCVHKEYPNKVSHVLNSDADVAPPRKLTPAFSGCYDWHSSVHGHWLWRGSPAPSPTPLSAKRCGRRSSRT
jgi:hypothetical protein